MDKNNQAASLTGMPDKAVNADRRNVTSLMCKKPSESPIKLGKDEISRCIALWAQVYGVKEDVRKTKSVYRRDLPVLRTFDW